MTRAPEENALAERYAFARDLARRVGLEALRFWQDNGTEGLGIQAKGLQDFVTIADQQAEQTIRSELARMFPEDGFVGEETGGTPNPAGTWVVDPIDGTANYLRGLRHWGVSIAFVSSDRPLLGIVHDTPTDRLYHARTGHGAFCDDQRIHASKTTDPNSAMGILGASRRMPLDLYLGHIRSLHDAGIEYRRIGSAAIGTVRVAEGVADFYYEAHLNSWDAMAAVLIAQEAGAIVKMPPIDEFLSRGGEVLCATQALSQQLESLLVQTL